MIIHLLTLLILLLTAISCALPGLFLMLRGISLMSDAISHAILPGIVLMFLLVHNLQSPLLMVGASCAGIATVLLTEKIIQTHRLTKDAAIGLIFPLFFSLGVILISLFARTVHLDTDMVLLGDVAFAPFNTIQFHGYNLGPQALWTMIFVLIFNSLCIFLFFKELVISTFDAPLAHHSGLYPTLVYYALMIITSITTVSAFNHVGSIVVVSLMIAPAATAYMLSHHLHRCLLFSILISWVNSSCGYWCAWYFDVSIAGAIATFSGIFFLISCLVSPIKGILCQWMYARKQKKILDCSIVYHQIAKHSYVSFEILCLNLGWSPRHMQRIIKLLIRQKKISQTNTTVFLNSRS